MFKVVPVFGASASDSSGGWRGKELIVSLSSTLHDHSEPSGRGIIIIIGDGGRDDKCDVPIRLGYNRNPSKKCLVLRLVSRRGAHVDANPTGGERYRAFMPPRDANEEAACDAAADGIVLVIDDIGGESRDMNYITNGVGSSSLWLRPGCRHIVSSLSLPSSAQMRELAEQHGPIVGAEGPPQPASVRIGVTDNQYVEITRLPINACLCPGISSNVRDEIAKVAPGLGLCTFDDAVGLNAAPHHPFMARTHVISVGSPNDTIAASAWCLEVPICHPKFILEGLASRTSPEDDLPNDAQYPCKLNYYSKLEQVTGMGNDPSFGHRDPLNGFMFISLGPSRVEGLCLAAGAAVIRSYLMNDLDFEMSCTSGGIFLPNENEAKAKAGLGTMVAIDILPDEKTCRTTNDRKAIIMQRTDLPFADEDTILRAVTAMRGFFTSMEGELVTKQWHMKTASFRLEWTEVCSIEQMPCDILFKIFNDFMGGTSKQMPSFLRLAASSKTIQNLVFQRSPYLWTTVDLTLVDQKYRRRLRDRQLEALLRNVNAKAVTERLVLRGCRGLRGSGIVPLCESKILKEIDLQFCGGRSTYLDPIPDADVMCRVVKSMPPFVKASGDSAGLILLRLDKYYYPSSRPSFRVTEERRVNTRMIYGLQEAFGDRLAKSHSCRDCGHSLRHRLLTEYARGDITMEAPYTVCPDCHEIFCGLGSCKKVQLCNSCLKNSCQSCTEMKTCGCCDEIFCCVDFLKCVECGEVECEECVNEIDGDLRQCSVCDKVGCSDCIGIAWCAQCEDGFCEGPHGTNLCSACDDQYCNECQQLFNCPVCGGSFCSGCSNKAECQKCGEYSCSECMGANCASCKEYTCLACVSSSEDGPILFSCSMCDKSNCSSCTTRCPAEEKCTKEVCKVCLEKQKGCSSCGAKHCGSCRFLCSSDGCFKSVCKPCSRLSKNGASCCGTCRSLFCKDCSDEIQPCSECEEPFCTSYECAHGEGGGSLWCDKCEVRFCEECLDAHLYRCDSGDVKDDSIVPWSCKYDERVGRHIANLRKDPEYFISAEGSLIATSPIHDDFQKKPAQTRRMLAMAMYVFVDDKHGTIAVLDAESPNIQPRITKYFKKKKATTTTKKKTPGRR